MFGGQHISIDLINEKSLLALLNYTSVPTNMSQKVRVFIHYKWEKGPNSLEDSQTQNLSQILAPTCFFSLW